MVCGQAANTYKNTLTVSLHSYTFKVVRSFKYLGLHFDQRASAAHMINE